MAKVKIKVPTVDLIAPSKVPQTASARRSLMGSAVNMMPSSVPGTLKMGDLPLSQSITQQEMQSALGGDVAFGPLSLTENGKTSVAPGEKMPKAKAMVNKKKKKK